MDYKKLKELAAEAGWPGMHDETFMKILNWMSCQTVLDAMIDKHGIDVVLEAFYPGNEESDD